MHWNWSNIWSTFVAPLAVALLVLAAAAAVRWLKKISDQNAEQLRRDDEFKADWYGRAARAGHVREPGVMERLAKIEGNTESVADKVEHIAARQDSLEAAQLRSDQRLDDHLKTHGVMP